MSEESSVNCSNNFRHIQHNRLHSGQDITEQQQQDDDDINSETIHILKEKIKSLEQSKASLMHSLVITNLIFKLILN